MLILPSMGLTPIYILHTFDVSFLRSKISPGRAGPGGPHGVWTRGPPRGVRGRLGHAGPRGPLRLRMIVERVSQSLTFPVAAYEQERGR